MCGTGHLQNPGAIARRGLTILTEFAALLECRFVLQCNYLSSELFSNLLNCGLGISACGGGYRPPQILRNRHKAIVSSDTSDIPR